MKAVIYFEHREAKEKGGGTIILDDTNTDFATIKNERGTSTSRLISASAKLSTPVHLHIVGTLWLVVARGSSAVESVPVLYLGSVDVLSSSAVDIEHIDDVDREK